MKRKDLKKNKKGFTLVEIIVVLVIMGILLAIAVPSVMGYINKAKDSEYLAQGRNGYLGASTIVTKKNLNKVESKASDYTGASISEEIGDTESIDEVACTVTGEAGKAVLGTCYFKVANVDNKYVKVEANKSAEVINKLPEGITLLK